MKTDRKKLNELLQGIVHVADRKPTIPALANVVARDGVLTASDLDVTMLVPFESDIEFCVNATQFSQLINRLTTDEIDLSMGKNFWLTIKAGASKYKLAGLDPSDFPVVATGDKEDGKIEMDFEALQSIVRRTLIASTQHPSKWVLDGIQLTALDEGDRVEAVGTDIARVSVAQDIGFGDLNCFVPHKLCLAILRSTYKGSVIMEQSRNSLLLTLGDSALMGRKVSGKFPDMDKFMAAQGGPLSKTTLPVSALQSAVQRALLTASKDRQTSFQRVDVKLEDGMLVVLSEDSDAGMTEDVTRVEYTNDPITFGVQARFLIDMFNSVITDTIELNWHGQSKGVFFYAGSDYHVIQPLIQLNR